MKKKKHAHQHQLKLRVQERSRKPICRNLKKKKLINEKNKYIHTPTPTETYQGSKVNVHEPIISKSKKKIKLNNEKKETHPPTLTETQSPRKKQEADMSKPKKKEIN